MRVVPPRDMIAYLESVGALTVVKRSPCAVEPTAGNRPIGADRSDAAAGIVVLTVVALMLGLVLLGLVASGLFDNCSCSVVFGSLLPWPTRRSESASVLGLTAPPPLPIMTTAAASDPKDGVVQMFMESFRGGIPSGDQPPWRSAVASNRGHVRRVNEDFGVCFRSAGCDVVVLADGCGGIPHGFAASRISVLEVARTLRSALVSDPPSNQEGAETLVASMFGTASGRLASIAPRYRSLDSQDVLQTTLLIAVTAPWGITLGYLGDGGAWLVRTSSAEVISVMEPMKAQGEALNVLAGAVGPVQLGQPVVRTVDRQPGDLLLLGTDGVFDYVDARFTHQVIERLVENDGRSSETLSMVLQDLADARDDAGHICTDNLTLALVIPDGCRPRFAPGFWRPSLEEAPRC